MLREELHGPNGPPNPRPKEGNEISVRDVGRGEFLQKSQAMQGGGYPVPAPVR